MDPRRWSGAEGQRRTGERRALIMVGRFAVFMADPPHFVKYPQTVIAFASSRACASGPAGRRRSSRASAGRRVWPPSISARSPAGLLYAVNRAYAERDRELATATRSRSSLPSPAVRFCSREEPLSSTQPCGRSPTDGPARSRPSSARHASSRAAARCSTSSTRPTRDGRGGHGTDSRGASARVRAVRGRDPPPRRPGRDRRDERRHRRLRPHRQDALAACKEAIDTLKETVPLWKKEVYEGGEEWIGRGS